MFWTFIKRDKISKVLQLAILPLKMFSSKRIFNYLFTLALIFSPGWSCKTGSISIYSPGFTSLEAEIISKFLGTWLD
jgi:hypothetical protein